MPLIVLNTKIENADAIKGIKRRWPAVIRTSLNATARYWLERKFPLHFAGGAAQKYNHEARGKYYKIVVKRREGIGDGKEYDDILTGVSRRAMLYSATVTATQHRSVIRMKAPAYFTDPYIGTSVKDVQQADGRIRRIIIKANRQPDKVREVTEVNAQDRADLQAFLQGDISLRARLALLGR